MTHSVFNSLSSNNHPPTPQPITGFVVGIVTNNSDPDGMGRVKVKFPRISEIDESNWARVVTFMAGPNQGSAFIPEVNDEVLVGFEFGDINMPYVVGSLWNGVDKPFEETQSGHLIIKAKSIQLEATEGDVEVKGSKIKLNC